MHYSIVFTGKIRDGATLSETRHNLAEMFKIGDAAVLDKVFSGKTVVLKKGLSEDEARKQEMILYMAGAVCELRNNAPPPAPTPPPAPAAVAEASAAPAAATPAPAQTVSAFAASLAPPLPAAMPAMAGGLALMPDSCQRHPEAPVPAALRGHARNTEAEDHAVAQAGKVTVTHHGRDGEGLADPMQAPWDPAFMPDGVKGLSWAGFMAPLLWGSFNGMRLSFLPLLGIRLFRHFVPVWAWAAFYLAFGGFYLVKGRQLAWENKQWRNGEHFNRVQRYWTIGGAAFFVLVFWGLAHIALQDQRAKLMIQAAAAVAVADEAVARAETPQTRAGAIVARTQARDQLLAAIDDPAARERERQNFAEQDRAEAESAAPVSSEADSPPPSE
jgi:hypothetical protein